MTCKHWGRLLQRFFFFSLKKVAIIRMPESGKSSWKNFKLTFLKLRHQRKLGVQMPMIALSFVWKGHRSLWKGHRSFCSDLMKHALRMSSMQAPVGNTELSLLQVHQWADTNSAVPSPSRWEEEQGISLACQDKFYRHSCGHNADRHLPLCLGEVRHLIPWLKKKT